MDKSVEHWLNVVGYEGVYKVSSLGKVKSLDRFVDHPTQGRPFLKGKLLSQNHTKAGYRTVVLTKLENGVRYMKNLKVHRLVAIAFIQNVHCKRFVNHKNGIKSDNSVENLEWVTPSENTKHAFSIGLMNNPKGELSTTSKLTNAQVTEMRKNKGLVSNLSMSSTYGVTPSTISRILNNNGWKHIQSNDNSSKNRK